MNPLIIGRFLKDTKVLVGPRRALAAYGPSRISYHIVSPIDDMASKSRLREGTVVSERPLILTADLLRERFEGFGDEAAEFTRWLSQEYKDLLRALEYRFRNEDLRTRVVTENHQALTRRIQEDLESRTNHDSVLIHCPDSAWSLALMKFTLEEAARSFSSHVRSYEEHGLFDPGATTIRRQKREIESLFARAESDNSARNFLGAKLKEYGLLPEYEDRFLSLFH